MTRSFLFLLLAAPAAATPAAMSATLEALSSQAAADPAALTRENASVTAGRTFDQSFTVQTLAPVEYVAFGGEPRKNPPPILEETPPAVNPGEGTDYYFEGKKPLNGITIYTPVKGEGSTSEGESPTAKYGQYGKYAMIGGAALLVVGLALGGAPLVGLALAAGLLIGAGAVLSFLFGKKKK
ncbi:MAG: hypothetical protein NUW21_12165 [Elusimicrobia bacterium]|nr:hypothetical protein [Elusimicrobiota bacterium]